MIKKMQRNNKKNKNWQKRGKNKKEGERKTE